MDVFTRKLRERARQLGLSNAEVARRADLNGRRYGHYARGTREPNLETLVRICAVLETTPNDLLGFEAEQALTEESPAEQERRILRERLNAACNVLQTDNLRLTVKQVETLVQHQREQTGT